MKRLIQFTLLTFLSLFTGAMAQVSISKWQAQPIAIDGDGSDWGTNPRFFNADSNVKYEFRNDARNLYLIIKSADRAVQMQLLKAGFSVRLKVKAATPLRASITFPTSKADGFPPMQTNPGGLPDKLVDKSSARPELMIKDTAVLDGFQYAKGIITSDNRDENGICFSRSKSPRELTYYEIRVPLRELFGDNYVLESISSIPIQLQVNINDLSRNSMRKMRGRMGGGHSGGMGAGGRGGMGGGRNEGMGNDLQGQMENDLPGGNIGELSGQEGDSRGGFSMERKSFSKDFQLSANK
ncbi:MAG: hypothetical protein Q8904_11750 [Bacteroidota bacterium]|nr:hypothetical protein [Bacteroidota bacterium]